MPASALEHAIVRTRDAQATARLLHEVAGLQVGALGPFLAALHLQRRLPRPAASRGREKNLLFLFLFLFLF